MPRDTLNEPATLPVFSTSCASRTSTTSALSCAMICCAFAGEMRGTAALAVSINCFTLMVITLTRFFNFHQAGQPAGVHRPADRPRPAMRK
jgi:hypothetical protein